MSLLLDSSEVPRLPPRILAPFFRGFLNLARLLPCDLHMRMPARVHRRHPATFPGLIVRPRMRQR